MNNLGDLSDDRLLEDLGRLRGTGLRPRAHRTEDGLSIRLRAAERTPVEASTNDTELAATYTKIERLLTQQGYRAKQAAWAIVRLRARHTADLSRPTTVELVREAFLLLAPGSSAAR